MSKLDQRISAYAFRLAVTYGNEESDVKFGGKSLLEALDQQLLQPSIVLMMQHVGFALGVYSSAHVVTEQWVSEDSMFITTPWLELTSEQQETHSQYMKTVHPRLSKASEEMEAFLLYCAVKGALFLGKEPVDRPLAYTQKTMTLDHGIVVLDVLSTTMMSLVHPNQTIHAGLELDAPQTQHEMQTEPDYETSIE